MKNIIIASLMATTAFIGTASANTCSDRYENVSRFNPTTLSDYQRCIIDEVWTDKDSGRIGNLVWLRVGEDVVSVTTKKIREGGSEAIETVVVNHIVATELEELEAVKTELNRLQTELEDMRVALEAAGLPDEQVEAALNALFDKKYNEVFTDGVASVNITIDNADAIKAAIDAVDIDAAMLTEVTKFDDLTDYVASAQKANAVDYTPAVDAVDAQAETISIDESVTLEHGTGNILVEDLDNGAAKLYINGELVSSGVDKGAVVDAYFGPGARFTQSLTIVFVNGTVGFAIANAENTYMYSWIFETVGNSNLAVVTDATSAVDAVAAVDGSISIGTYSLTIGENTIADLDLEGLADIIEDVYNAGYDDGYKDGYNDGYVDGYNQGFQDGVNSVK